MIALLIVVLVVTTSLAGAIGLAIVAIRARSYFGKDERDWAVTGVAGIGAVLCLILALGIVGIGRGEINLSTSVADGCWRVSSSTSSGVGVGVNSKGGVTVVPVVLSGKSYTPIACP